MTEQDREADNLDVLMRIARELDMAQVALLTDMAKALMGAVEEEINPSSDILSPRFAGNFSNRLRIYHATNEEKFNKKAFEYAFVAAARYEGKPARVLPNMVAPDADIEVAEARYSLKTEAARNLNRALIRISKFAEARWIRDCATQEDFARETTTRIPKHLGKYERIFTLRAFDASGPSVRYELWEIPQELLMRVAYLEAKDFSPRSKAGSSGADVRMEDGSTAFRVILDGSVEKVTISNLRTDLCVLHGAWIVPVKIAEGQDEAN